MEEEWDYAVLDNSYNDYYTLDDIIEDAMIEYCLSVKDALKRFVSLTDKPSIFFKDINLVIYHKSIVDAIGNMEDSFKAPRGWQIIVGRILQKTEGMKELKGVKGWK